MGSVYFKKNQNAFQGITPEVLFHSSTTDNIEEQHLNIFAKKNFGIGLRDDTFSWNIEMPLAKNLLGITYVETGQTT